MATGMRERRFPIMGSTGHLVVVGGTDGLLDQGEARLRDLEACWTRFRPTSELSRLNAAAGRPVVVSLDTVTLVETLCRAWRATGGRFDPTVHDVMVALGYDRSWPAHGEPSAVATVPTPGCAEGEPSAVAAVPTPGCADILVSRDAGLVQLPAGLHLDPGGLGKGLAADLVAGELMAAGARGVLVNVGGDLRVSGTPPVGDAWSVAVERPQASEHPVAVVELVDGAVATSTSARRRWHAADGTTLHHLVDPATGRPAERPWSQVTVVAGLGWWAEALAKAVFLGGSLPDPHAAALVVLDDGATRRLGDPSWFAALEVAV